MGLNGGALEKGAHWCYVKTGAPENPVREVYIMQPVMRPPLGPGLRRSLAVALLLTAPAWLSAPSFAQTEVQDKVEAGDDAGTDGADLLDADALDDLVAPVALYPDALLSQVLMAATFPLDVMKADRFVDDAGDMTDRERADAAKAEDWDESVQVLASGFPDVIDSMAANIDWTEDLGDAMVAQTDDLLDSVQRLRGEAASAGNLESNDAQTVSDDAGRITIAPADPDVVYVPSYDPAAAYVAPVAVDSGVSTADVLTGGAIAFGAALLVGEIFDDDDDDWYGPGAIDWNDREIRVDRDVNRSVDRNIDRTINRTGDLTIDRDAWKPSQDQRDAARTRIAERKERPALDRQRPAPEVRDARRTEAAQRLKDRDPGTRANLDRTPADRKAALGEARARGSANLKGKNASARASEIQRPNKQISRPDPGKAHAVPPRKAGAKKSAFSKPSATARPHGKAAQRGHASARGHHKR